MYVEFPATTTVVVVVVVVVVANAAVVVYIRTERPSGEAESGLGAHGSRRS